MKWRCLIVIISIISLIVNEPYTKLAQHKRSDVRPFNHIGGLRPYLNEDQTITTAKDFNKEIAQKNIDNKSKEDFYLNIPHKNREEINYLRRQNKTDHIKKIDMTLNFKQKPTSYTETYNFTDEKRDETNNPDTLHHYKKSFMKTYEESKLKHLIIIRK